MIRLSSLLSLCLFLNAFFIPSAKTESVDSFLSLLKKTFVVQLNHACCKYIAESYLMKNDIKYTLPLCQVVSQIE